MPEAMTTRDPIVDEVREARMSLASKFDFDIDAIAQDAQRRQHTSGHVVVRRPPRPARPRPLEADDHPGEAVVEGTETHP
ncbi:MAG: hypothetical protein FLDDKLPJ_02687 [Phycisphaerae bacterium]|nr:hypothetical protein [Phycisphaerae bacterium]